MSLRDLGEGSGKLVVRDELPRALGQGRAPEPPPGQEDVVALVRRIEHDVRGRVRDVQEIGPSMGS